jgi:hypothetical protein
LQRLLLQELLDETLRCQYRTLAKYPHHVTSSVPEQLKGLVHHYLTPERSCNQAERSALLHPEVSEGHRGRIADGSIADLLVVRGNPVDDIDMVACQDNHLGVIKGGA